MAKQETIDKLKLDRRFKHSQQDSDLGDLVDACLLDLATTAGVTDPDETDALVFAAIRLYVRSFLTDDTKTGADYETRYEKMKASLQMAAGYGGGE